VPAGMNVVPPSMAEVIAFGGIPDMSRAGIRLSVRIRVQPDADSTQLERAIHITQLRDSPSQLISWGSLNCLLVFVMSLLDSSVTTGGESNKEGVKCIG
jgi:hypothetical protein